MAVAEQKGPIKIEARELPENAPNVFPLLAIGLALGMTLVLAGILFMRRKPRG